MNTPDDQCDWYELMARLDKLRKQRAKLRLKLARRDVRIGELKDAITGYRKVVEGSRAKYESACEKIDVQAAKLRKFDAMASRIATAEQQVEALIEQRDRLVALADDLGRMYNAADNLADPNDTTPVIDPASTIALDPVRWADWSDGRPQMPITEA